MSVCGREKCAFKRKPYPPGEHGRKRVRRGRLSVSDYGAQLREKQKLKFLYGLREAQFKNYVQEASKSALATTQKLLELLEARLDNVVYRLGFAQTRSLARQLVSHGHITVNGRKVTIPSFLVKLGDKVEIKAQSLSSGVFLDLDLYLKKYSPPSWFSLDKEKKEGEIVSAPDAADPALAQNINVNAIVEFYSR